MDAPLSVPDEVIEIFRQYHANMREVIELSFTFYLKGWPDKRDALGTVLRLGHLNLDISLLRFEYLVDHHLLAPKEDTLKASSRSYRHVLFKMETDQSVHEPQNVSGPIEDAGRDPEYKRPVGENLTKHWALEERLKAAVRDWPSGNLAR
jgi:hypothetical protein